MRRLDGRMGRVVYKRGEARMEVFSQRVVRLPLYHRSFRTLHRGISTSTLSDWAALALTMIDAHRCCRVPSCCSSPTPAEPSLFCSAAIARLQSTHLRLQQLAHTHQCRHSPQTLLPRIWHLSHQRVHRGHVQPPQPPLPASVTYRLMRTGRTAATPWPGNGPPACPSPSARPAAPHPGCGGQPCVRTQPRAAPR